MKNALELRVEYGRDGKPLRKEWSIGAIVVWGIVAIVAMLTGYAYSGPQISDQAIS
jgi:hypothetical protein